MQQIPELLPCPSQCLISCTAVCPPACCVTTSPHHPGVYSFPVPHLQTASGYQCSYPCSTACATKCSSKCCNTVQYGSPVYLKRKAILRKRKKHKLPRGVYNLFQLKKLSTRKKDVSNKEHLVPHSFTDETYRLRRAKLRFLCYKR